MIRLTLEAENMEQLQALILQYLGGQEPPKAAPTKKAASRKVEMPDPAPATEATPAPEVTLQQVREKLAALRADKGVDVVRGLLDSIGAKTLMEVKPDQYQTLMEAADAAS